MPDESVATAPPAKAEATAGGPGAGARRRRAGGLATAAAGVVLAALPLFLNTYSTTTATQIVTYTLLAASLMLVMGVAGMPSLGQAGMFGVGGYAAGLLAAHATSSLLAMLPVAMLAGGLVAGLTGWMLVRGRVSHLIMLTLAIGELLSLGAISWVGVTGGSDGLANLPTVTLGAGADLTIAGQMYWVVLLCVAALLFVIWRIQRSPLGRTLRGIRDNEVRMRALGYPTRAYRYALYVVAGVFSGAAGGLWVAQNYYISPSDMNFNASALALLALCVGGMESIWGVAAGAALIIVVQNMLPTNLQGEGPLVLGLILIACVYLVPGGLASLVERAAGGRGRR